MRAIIAWNALFATHLACAQSVVCQAAPRNGNQCSRWVTGTLRLFLGAFAGNMSARNGADDDKAAIAAKAATSGMP